MTFPPRADGVAEGTVPLSLDADQHHGSVSAPLSPTAQLPPPPIPFTDMFGINIGGLHSLRDTYRHNGDRSKGMYQMMH